MNRIFKAGLVGAGGFARIHLQALELLRGEGLVDFIAVADPQIQALSAKEDWNQRPELRLYNDYKTLLAEESCDLVGIATPPFLHFEMTETALNRSQAFLYLEKPPVPLYTQLERLIENPGSRRVAIGFQFLESDVIRAVKRRLVSGEIGEILSIRASSMTPRNDWYYQRSGWSGRLALGGNPVFDGPASNGIAHLVHLVMYFAGNGEGEFGLPETVTGKFFRARPIESYDFAWLAGSLPGGTAYEVAVGHSSDEHHPWVVRIEGTKGEIVFRQSDMEGGGANSVELLARSYRSALRAADGETSSPTSTLENCSGYLQAVCGGFTASQGVADVDPADIKVIGEGSERIYSVPKAINLVTAISSGRKSELWFEAPPQINAVDAARTESPLFSGHAVAR